MFHVQFCCFLTCIQISQEAGQVVWYSNLFQNFPQFIVIHTVKGFENESEVPQSCLTLCNPMDSNLPGSAVHGIFQARILEWAVISFSRGSSQPRDQTRVSCIAVRSFTVLYRTLQKLSMINCTVYAHFHAPGQSPRGMASWFWLSSSAY